MIKKCGFSRKRVSKTKFSRNTPRTIGIRHDKYLEYMTYVLRDYKFIYIDESGFNDHVASVYGYSKIGEHIFLKTPPRAKNISSITAVT